MCQKLKTIWSQHYHHQSKVSLQLQKIAPTLRYPSLSPVHPESSVAGNDIFAKFSAWIKCATDHPNYASKSKKLLFSKFFDFFWSKFVSALQQRFIQSLSKLDAFLKTKLSENSEDARLFLDSNRMTLADCNLLPKLHIALTAARHRRNFQLPEVTFQSLKPVFICFSLLTESKSTCKMQLHMTSLHRRVATMVKSIGRMGARNPSLIRPYNITVHRPFLFFACRTKKRSIVLLQPSFLSLSRIKSVYFALSLWPLQKHPLTRTAIR